MRWKDVVKGPGYIVGFVEPGPGYVVKGPEYVVKGPGYVL